VLQSRKTDRARDLFLFFFLFLLLFVVARLSFATAILLETEFYPLLLAVGFDLRSDISTRSVSQIYKKGHKKAARACSVYKLQCVQNYSATW
jgi:hypothetical protein